MKREKGYSLAYLIVAITVLNVVVATALPVWSTFIKREKEEELIFRGLQYAEAIRVFKRRFGRYPNKLEELLKNEPRSIRQLWRDPMTGKVDWVPIVAIGSQGGPAGIPGGVKPPKGGKGGGLPPILGGGKLGPKLMQMPKGDLPLRDKGLPSVGDGDMDDSFGDTDKKLITGPIKGVRSRSKGKAMKIFLGKDRYNQWAFTEELLLYPVGIGKDGGVPRLNAIWIGRPLRPGLATPQPGGKPGAPPTGGPLPPPPPGVPKGDLPLPPKR